MEYLSRSFEIIPYFIEGKLRPGVGGQGCLARLTANEA